MGTKARRQLALLSDINHHHNFQIKLQYTTRSSQSPSCLGLLLSLLLFLEHCCDLLCYELIRSPLVSGP